MADKSKQSNMPVTILYTTGLHQEVYAFEDIAEKNRWETEVMAIKEGSAAAFNKKETEGLTTAVRTLYDNWMARVIAFKDQFTEARTPMDIKWALNTAQQALGVNVTQWDNPPDASLFE